MGEIQIADLITALHRWYMENGAGRPLEYTYGFFDALGVIRSVLSGGQ